MELKEFVREVLVQIQQGVEVTIDRLEAEDESSNGRINPKFQSDTGNVHVTEK